MKKPTWQRWAEFRFGVVGPLLAAPPSEHGDLKSQIDELAAKTWSHRYPSATLADPGHDSEPRSKRSTWGETRRVADEIARQGSRLRRNAQIIGMPELTIETWKKQIAEVEELRRQIASMKTSIASAGRKNMSGSLFIRLQMCRLSSVAPAALWGPFLWLTGPVLIPR